MTQASIKFDYMSAQSSHTELLELEWDTEIENVDNLIVRLLEFLDARSCEQDCHHVYISSKGESPYIEIINRAHKKVGLIYNLCYKFDTNESVAFRKLP